MRLKVTWVQARDWAVPVLASFVTFVITVIRPLSRTSQEYAFLYYTALLLFFFPRNRLLGQLRVTVYGIVGSALGLAWAIATLAVAAWCGRRYGSDSDQSRAVIGTGLALLSLICGFSKSYKPQLVAASNIALFFPIFLLTAQQAVTQIDSALFTDQFLVTLFAAASGLFATILLPRPSASPKLDALLASTVETTCQILPLSLASVLDFSLTSTPADTLQQRHLAGELRGTLANLKAAHNDYCSEFTRSNLAPAALLPYIRALHRIHRNALLGPTSHVPGERIRAAMERTYERHSRPATPRTSDGTMARAGSASRSPSARGDRNASPNLLKHSRQRSHAIGRLTSTTHKVTETIQQCLTRSLITVRSSYGWTSAGHEGKDEGTGTVGFDLDQSRKDLEIAVMDLQRRLASMVDELSVSPNVDTGHSHPSVHFRDRWRLAFYVVALIDLAKDVDHLLETTAVLQAQTSSTKRLFLPFMKTKDRPPAEPLSNGPDDDPPPPADFEKHWEDMDFVTATLYQSRLSPSPDSLFGRVEHVWRQIWDQKAVLKVRVMLSHAVHHLKHSRHGQFALKMAIGVTLLSIPALLSPGSTGRDWFLTSRGAWMVVSYMYVLEVHTGAILKIAVQRAIGTFIGSVAAYICTLIAQDNPYALVTLATTCSVPITYVILFTSRPLIAVIVGITLPPLLFLSYLNLDDGLSDFTLAWTRFVDIVIGIAAAVVVGTTIWPNHARVRYFLAVSGTMEKATDYYLHMSRDLLRSSLVYQNDDRMYTRLEREVRSQITISRNLIAIQKREVSLLPRPIKLYSEIIDASDRLVEVLCEIRILRFNVPRKSSVLDVLPIRRELVSAILTNLWALGQSFKSRAALPQYLPSTRVPLDELVDAIDAHSRARNRSWTRQTPTSASASSSEATVMARGDDDSSPAGGRQEDLGTLYSMAENEALVDLCNIIDQLIAAARTLFGSQTFWDQPAHQD